MFWQFIHYCWDILVIAFSGAWGIANSISFIVSIVCGFITWKQPAKETTIKHLHWIIPSILFGIFFISSVAIIAPYRIYQNQQQEISRLKNELTAQKYTANKDTKQAIRNFFKVVNPKILNKIDEGEWAIWVRMGLLTSGRLNTLSKYPDFNSFLLYKEADANEAKIMEKSPFTIDELDKDDYFKHYYFLFLQAPLINEGN